MPLADRQGGVGLGLVGAEAALGVAPGLAVLLQGQRLEGAGGAADRAALEVLVAGDAGVLAGQYHLDEGEVGDAHADGLGPLQGVRGGCDDHVGATRHQRRDAVGKGRLDDLRLDVQGLRQVVAVIDVEAHRVVLCIARAHRRKVQGDGAAQLAGLDDVVELVGLGETGEGTAQGSGEG